MFHLPSYYMFYRTFSAFSDAAAVRAGIMLHDTFLEA
jgi:hypothetical protein